MMRINYDEEVSNATHGEICDLGLRISGQIESLTHKALLCKFYKQFKMFEQDWRDEVIMF